MTKSADCAVMIARRPQTGRTLHKDVTRMRRFAAWLFALFLFLPIHGTQAEGTAYPTASPLPGYTLCPAEEERLVFTAMSLKANLAGTLLPGAEQQAEVLQVIGEWCYIRFSAGDGMRYGYVPSSYFVLETAASTPIPAADETSYEAGASAWVVGWAEGYRLSLRKEPSYSAAILGKYYTGTPVVLTGQAQDGYVQVLLADITAWADARFITLDADAFVPEMPMVTVDNPGSGANLRAAPSSSGSRLGWYADGTAVTVLGVRADGWYHVQVEGQTGYMSSGLLSGSFPYENGLDSDHPALADGGTACYINMRSATGQLNLRKSASASAKSLGLFYTGAPVTVMSYTRTGWAYVRIGQVAGYVDADYLTGIQPARYGESRVVRNAGASGLNLRALPGTGGELLAFAENGTRVTVLGELSDGWCYVSWDGTLGYMLGTGLSSK